MWKMSAKKRSCFEITSVTPAQVGGSAAGEPLDAGLCERLSPEESPNPGGEAPEGQPAASGPGGLSGGRGTPGSSMVTSASAAVAGMSQAAPSGSCSSRFRVIKLDHSNGEPFRRGRWTCTEFYVKDSDVGAHHRAVDSLKSSLSFDHAGDRDSGLGATCSSSSSPAQVLENCTDSGYGVSARHHSRSHAGESQQPGVGSSSQVASGASAFQPTASSTSSSATATQECKQAPGTAQTLSPDCQQFVSSTHPSQQHLRSAAQNPPLASTGGVAGPGGQAPAADAGSIPGVVQQVGGGSVVSGSAQQQPSTSAIVLATVPSPAGAPPGASGQGPGGGGPADDGWQVRALPHRSPIGDGFSFSSPTVNSFFGIQITMNEDGDGASGASVVAIDNKIEQAMDLVKSHLMYAVREEVEVLKVQIKELYERNSVLERENAVLKSLANTHQLSQLSPPPQPLQLHQPPFIKAAAHQGSQGVSYQPNITSA